MPASSRDTNTHHAPSVSRGPSLNLLPDKSQTLILPSLPAASSAFTLRLELGVLLLGLP